MAKSLAEMSNVSHHNNLMVVDSLNLAFRYKHNKTKNYASKYLETIRSLAQSYEASEVIITADFKGSSFRVGVYPEYKANRKALQEKQTEEERAEFKEFIGDYVKTLELLEASGFTVLRYEGVEADDLAAYLVKYHSVNYGHTWLISTDRDWDLLISDSVSRFSYTSRKEVTLDTWGQHYDYEPEEHISIKVLEGDKGDNVPGVAGIGPKRAIVLLGQFGSALDVYDAIPIDQKYKHIQALNLFKEQLLVNYELMDLLTFCEDAIGEDNIKDIEGKL